MNNTINSESLEDGIHSIPVRADAGPSPDNNGVKKDLSSALNQGLDWETYQNHLL